MKTLEMMYATKRLLIHQYVLVDLKKILGSTSYFNKMLLRKLIQSYNKMKRFYEAEKLMTRTEGNTSKERNLERRKFRVNHEIICYIDLIKTLVDTKSKHNAHTSLFFSF